jgi:hypothetical protein
MVAAAAWRLTNELPRLLAGPGGAFDLQLRHREVQRWFSGEVIYGPIRRGDYPPASYVILWPLLGWLSLQGARILWAVTSLAGLAWLAFLAVRESGARSRPQVLLLALLPFSVYASSATLAMGQIINHTLPLLLAGLLLLRRSPGRWRDDLPAAGLLLAALVKPPIVVPFFWLVCFVPGRLRPILLVCGGYAALTMIAAAFQNGPLSVTLFGWLGETPQVLAGHTNFHKWLALAGLRTFMLPVSVTILAGLAWWVHRYRCIDYWILLGVCALVAQFWIHHRLYDHLLLVVPMVTLFRIARQGPTPDGSDLMAGALFALTWFTVHAPASLLGEAPPLGTLMEAGQTVIWLAVLAFLLHRARRDMTGYEAQAFERDSPVRPAPV